MSLQDVASNQSPLEDVSSSSSLASMLEDNTEMISAEVGINCWGVPGLGSVERAKVVIDTGDVSKLPAVDVHQLRQEFTATKQDLHATSNSQREKKYEAPVMRLLSTWIKKEKRNVIVEGKEYELHIGKKQKNEECWEGNMRKGRMLKSEPDLLLYIVKDDGRRITIAIIEMKSKNGKVTTPEECGTVRSAVQQAACYAITFQRPMMSKENGVKSFRLPVLVLYENCAFWVSMTTDDALVYPYTMTVRKYVLGDPKQISLDILIDTAVRIAVSYVRSVLEPGLYDADNGFKSDTSQLLLPVSLLEFPPVRDGGIRRSVWANNVFRGDTTALSTGYFVNPVYESPVLKTGETSQPVVMKIVSSTCYNMQNSVLYLVLFLKELRNQIQQIRPENKAKLASDAAVDALTSTLGQLSVSGGGDTANQLAETLERVYSAYLWIGGRGERRFSNAAGKLLVMKYLGESVLNSNCTDDVLKMLFSSGENSLAGAFVNQIFLPAFASIVYASYCHLDIRPANVMVLKTNHEIRFHLIDWDEVVPVIEFLDRVQSSSDSWYPSVCQVNNSRNAAIVFTACQLFLCVFVMRCTAASATGVERSVRSKKKFWNGSNDILSLIPARMTGREEFKNATMACYTHLKGLLDGTQQLPAHLYTCLLQKLNDYLTSCAL